MAMVALAMLSAFARTVGWENVNPERKDFPPQKILWQGDLSQAKFFPRANVHCACEYGDPELREGLVRPYGKKEHRACFQQPDCPPKS